MKPPPPLNGYSRHVPHSFLGDTTLPAAARLLYLIIRALAWKTGYCSHSAATLGTYVELADQQTRHYLLLLETTGWLRIERRNGAANRYYPLDDWNQTTQPPYSSNAVPSQPLYSTNAVAPDHDTALPPTTVVQYQAPRYPSTGVENARRRQPPYPSTDNKGTINELINEDISKRPALRRSDRATTPEPLPSSPYIASVILDFNRELGDPHDAANITQAHRLWRESGLDETTFVQRCYAAKRKLRLSQAGVDNKGAYFFTLLRQEVQAA